MPTKDILALRLQPRICKLATEDIIEIVDRVGGSGTYSSIIREMDKELARRRLLRRKGPRNMGTPYQLKDEIDLE